MASATGIFLFRQHFLSIPRDLGDAARIDGTGPWGYLFRALVPMSGNTIGALAVIQIVYVWDQYLWPRVIIPRRRTPSGPSRPQLDHRRTSYAKWSKSAST